MNDDQHASTTTPPPTKRRRIMSAVALTPPRLSDLMAAFGARRAPTSAKRERQSAAGHDMRAKTTVNYAESESSAHSSPKSTSSFGEVSGSSKTSLVQNSKPESEDDDGEEDSEDELQAGNAVQVTPRPESTRQLPARSTRTQVSYARPVRPIKKKGSKHRKILKSDTNRPASKPVADTARMRVRQAISEQTKPKRDAFILAHKDYFLPVLPETSYVDKLERLHAMRDGDDEPVYVKYAAITEQPRKVKATMKAYQLEGLS